MNSKSLLLIFFVIPLQIFAQEGDTIFLSKSTEKGTAQSVFIDTNRNSKFYPTTSFQFDKRDSLSYFTSIENLKKNKIALAHQTPVIEWTKWLDLKIYKGNYYAYHPCDFNSFHALSINDSTLINWKGEGPEAVKIIAQKKIDSSTYYFNLTGQYHDHVELLIHIIDADRGIAIMEGRDEEGGSGYNLMIAADKIRSVPIIVNNCETEKQAEWNFEQVDFKKLLRKK